MTGWALLLTQARAAWVALGVVYVAFLLLVKSRRAWASLGVFIVFLVVLALSIGPVRSRLETLVESPLRNEALVVRARSWKNTFRLIRENPFLGVGPRNFDLIDHEKYNLVGWNHAHSLYINTTAEMGALGAIALVALLAGCWVTLGRVRKKCLSIGRYGYWLASFGALLIIMVSGVVATTLHTESAIVFSLLMGISVSAVKTKENRIAVVKGEVLSPTRVG